MGFRNINGVMDCAMHTKLAESHEDRIGSLESNLSEVSVNIAKLQTHQEYMSESINTSSRHIMDKLEEVSTKINRFEDRIEPLELKERNERIRSKNIKNIMKSGLIALIGAVAAGAGKWIWSLVSGN